MTGRVTVEQSGHLVRLIIDNPTKANAVSPEMAGRLVEGLAQAGRDHQARAVVLRGAGTQAFCSGFELGRITGGAATGLEELMEAIAGCPVPVVAAVNGHAVGAGFELACRCDLRVVRRGVRLGLPAVRLGVAYRADGLATVVRTVPGARHLLLTGGLQPVESLVGFADVLADQDEFEATTGAVVAELLGAAPGALSYTTRVLRALGDEGLGAPARDRFADERRALMAGPDIQEAASAKRDGRPAEFRPRPT